MRRADFMQHPHAAKLSECEVVALRMYTLPAFKDINDPLRDLARLAADRAHPLAVLTEHLTRAIKKLRRIGASEDAATQVLPFCERGWGGDAPPRSDSQR
jgi:hypothetical protein